MGVHREKKSPSINVSPTLVSFLNSTTTRHLYFSSQWDHVHLSETLTLETGINKNFGIYGSSFEQQINRCL